MATKYPVIKVHHFKNNLRQDRYYIIIFPIDINSAKLIAKDGNIRYWFGGYPSEEDYLFSSTREAVACIKKHFNVINMPQKLQERHSPIINTKYIYHHVARKTY